MGQMVMVILLGVSLASSATADELLCASKKNESLYYTTGQIRLRAKIVDTTLLANISLGTTGSDKLGLDREEIQGKVRGEFVRFDLGSDAWCSYRLALPKGFITREKATAFVDAFCEENANANVRLYCMVR